ncbi:MAG: hypothetical protein KDA50_06130 [Rhodobacteraceae bacterium]|nr:hypothetical protein [Paracoccaceae bacterium]
MPGTSPRPGSGWGIVAFGGIAALAWGAFYILVMPHPARSGAVLPWLRMALELLLPLLLICLATALGHTVRRLQGEAAELRAELSRLRSGAGPKPASRAKDTALRGAAAAPVPAAAAPEPASLAPATDAGQARLPLGTAPAPALSLPDLIRALHFPETPDDRQGFRALSLALRDHRARLVVQAAQDMLTLMSQDGIYVDDLDQTLLPPAAWRQFAGEERRTGAADLALFQGSAEAARCAERLQGNTVYRDTAHHFLRRFDRLLADLVPEISDDAVTALTATRSARAFLLLGAAAGTFDLS